MTGLRKSINKVWVFAAATALIAGSSLAMTMILGNVSADASPNIVTVTNAEKQTNSPQATTTLSELDTGETDAPVEYTVIDRSKTVYENKDKLMEKLSFRGMPQEQLEKECNTILSRQIPGEKDITADEAAAYGAAVLKQALGAELSGYTADASFMRGNVPNSDTWGVTFRLAEDKPFYFVDMNSVSGTIINASGYHKRMQDESGNVNLNDPAWKEKAVQLVSKLLPEGVSVSSSQVVSARQDVGVTIVCDLSNGTAYGVRMIGENKEAEAFLFFPEGYDGSLDEKLAPKPLG